MKNNKSSLDIDNIITENRNNNISLSWIQRQVAGDKLSEMHKQLEEKQRQILEAKQSNQNLQKDLDASKKKHHELVDELKKNAELIGRLRQERDQLVTPVENLKNELEASKHKIQEYKKIENNWLNIKGELENSIKNLNDKIKNIEIDRKNVEEQNKEIQKEISRLNEINKDLHIGLKKESEKHNEQISQYQAAWAKKEANQQAEHETLQQTISHLEEQLAAKKSVQEEAHDKEQSIISEFRQIQEDLHRQLEQIQEDCQNITSEKDEAAHQAAMRQEEIDVIQSRLEQHEREMQQQAEQFDFAIERYRRALRNVQLSGGIALRQVMGAFSAALVRSALVTHAPELLADYNGIAEATEAMQACGQWFADLQLCADFDLHQEDGALSCAWRAPHPVGDPAMTNEWVVGMLWALLNTKTDQQWSCHRAVHDEAQAMQVTFRPIHD